MELRWRKVAHLGGRDEGVGELFVLESKWGVEGIEDDEIERYSIYFGVCLFFEVDLNNIILYSVSGDEIADWPAVWNSLEGGEEGGNLQSFEGLPTLLKFIGECSRCFTADGGESGASQLDIASVRDDKAESHVFPLIVGGCFEGEGESGVAVFIFFNCEGHGFVYLCVERVHTYWGDHLVHMFNVLLVVVDVLLLLMVEIGEGYWSWG